MVVLPEGSNYSEAAVLCQRLVFNSAKRSYLLPSSILFHLHHEQPAEQSWSHGAKRGQEPLDFDDEGLGLNIVSTVCSLNGHF